MGDIARTAQVARATVYNNFDDKQDILAAIIKDYMTGYALIESVLSSFDVSSSEEEINKAAHQLALMHWYAICSVPPKDAPRSPLGRK